VGSPTSHTPYPSAAASDYDGDIQWDATHPTFPWLTWNNRPFVSPAELLLVPATTQPGLLLEHGVFVNSFNPFNPSASADPDPNAKFRDGFRHLLSFFTSADGAAATARGESPEFSRLLDYVDVPSRFAGTTETLDPREFSGLAPGYEHALHPPFNKLSRFREPGKINLNTVFDPLVWDALTDGAFGYNGSNQTPQLPRRWREFAKSRQGYGRSAVTTTEFEFSKHFPTMFANPIRPAGANPLVPPVLGKSSGSVDGLMQTRDVHVTMLRSSAENSTPPPLDPSDFGMKPDMEDKPLFAMENNGQPYNDPDRNPYFRYAGLQKIYNSVTTRSNVYAMWVTVGYFEVTPVAIDAGHPDGWELGPEIGTDTGEIQRHRAFYLYDRTIPVGFERGETLNVEDGLLIQRYIE
jgi:hypothetical protein